MINDTLAARGNNYGIFLNVATTSQQLKYVLSRGASYRHMDPDMLESLDMICNKLSRIVNGNPFYADSWHDIMGYAALVDNKLQEE